MEHAELAACTNSVVEDESEGSISNEGDVEADSDRDGARRRETSWHSSALFQGNKLEKRKISSKKK